MLVDAEFPARRLEVRLTRLENMSVRLPQQPSQASSLRAFSDDITDLEEAQKVLVANVATRIQAYPRTDQGNHLAPCTQDRAERAKRVLPPIDIVPRPGSRDDFHREILWECKCFPQRACCDADSRARNGLSEAIKKCRQVDQIAQPKCFNDTKLECIAVAMRLPRRTSDGGHWCRFSVMRD